MVDNRPELRPSMRTARSRAKGLGPAGHGVGHWWLQRGTAIANVPLVIAFVVIVAMMQGRDYDAAVRLVSHPLAAILLLLAVLSVTNHMRLGMQVVIEDYVHDKLLRPAAVLANNFYAAAVAVACLYAILRISLR
jgi:succinate dehydrogenase / fumarate reductase, membrane anchor subunit